MNRLSAADAAELLHTTTEAGGAAAAVVVVGGASPDLLGRRLVRHRASVQGKYTLLDEPDFRTPLEMTALTGVTVDLKPLFGG